MAGKWGIDNGADWPGYSEEGRINRSRTNPTNVSDNTVTETPLLVDAKGKPLVVRKPRLVGFRPPTD